MNTIKRKRILIGVAFVALLMSLLMMGANLIFVFAAPGDVWSVSQNTEGWNQHLQYGGNPDATHPISVDEEGFAHMEIPGAGVQSYTQPIDLSRPFKFEYSMETAYTGGVRTSFGLAKSYRDCFWRESDGAYSTLNEYSTDVNQTDLVLQFSGNAETVFYLYDPNMLKGMTPGVMPTPNNYGTYNVAPNEVVELTIYIGTGESGDTSYIRLDRIGERIYGDTLPVTVTRNDFVDPEAIGVDGQAAPNDGNTAYFVHIGGGLGNTYAKRLRFAREIQVEGGDSLEHTIPAYVFDRDEFSFTVPDGYGVNIKKLDGSTERLLAEGEEKQYSYRMPVGGIDSVALTPAEHKVTFYDETEVLYTQFVENGETVSRPDDPVKAGMIFQNWVTEEGGAAFDFKSQVTGDLDLFTDWFEGVTVSYYDSDDPSKLLEQITVEKGEAAGDLPVFDSSDRKTLAYFTDQALTEPFTAETIVTENTDVFVAYTYRVTYHVRNFMENQAGVFFEPKNTPIDKPSVKEAINMVQWGVDVAIDSADIKWFTDPAFENEFDFAKGVTGPTDLYGYLVEKDEVNPYVTPDANGWDLDTGVQFDADGNYLTGEFYGNVGGVNSVPEGYSIFVLNNSGGIVNARGFDVSKPIYLDLGIRLTENPTGSDEGTKMGISWLVVNLTDTVSGAYLARFSDSGTTDLGSLVTWNQHTGKAPDAEGNLNDPVIQARIGSTALLGGIPNWNTTTGKAESYEKFAFNNYVINIGETAEDSYVEINGTRILNLSVTRSDFKTGKVYISLGSFLSTVYCLRISQEFSVELKVDGNGQADLVGDKAVFRNGDEVCVNVKADEGYRLAELTVNGTTPSYRTEEQEDGSLNYLFNMPFADAAIMVAFEEFNYRITFDLVYSTEGRDDPQKVYEGELVQKPDDPVRNGWKFLGWFTDEACTEAFDFSVAPTSDMVLYAGWEIVVYTLTLKDGDTIINTFTVEGPNKRFSEPDEPVKEGYTFMGWYMDAECTQLYSFNTIVTSDVTLYAKWDQTAATQPTGCSAGCSGRLDASWWGVFAIPLLGVAVVIGKKLRQGR